MKGRQTVVVQISLSTFVRASLGAARKFTLPARLRSRATILSASHNNEWHKGQHHFLIPDRCRWWRDLSATPHYNSGAAVIRIRSLSLFQRRTAKARFNSMTWDRSTNNSIMLTRARSFADNSKAISARHSDSSGIARLCGQNWGSRARE
jgi:hypothetical protein